MHAMIQFVKLTETFVIQAQFTPVTKIRITSYGDKVAASWSPAECADHYFLRVKKAGASIDKKHNNPNLQNVQGESKKSGISKNMAITTLKSVRKRKSWCVLENSA